MGSLSDYAEDRVISHLCATAYTPAATVYVALCTATVTDASTSGTMGEVSTSGTAYARQPISFGAPASRRVTQSGAITFAQATASWGTITDYAIMDASSAGNVLAYGTFTASFSPVTGNTPSIAAGQIYVQIDPTAAGAGFSTYFAEAFLNLMFRNQPFTQPATYVALATAVLSDGTTSPTEASGGGYARVLVNKAGGASPAWTTVSGGHADNANAITFPTPSATWGTITSCYLVDSATLGAGNVLGYDNANIVDQAIAANDTVQFAVGAFDLTIT